MSVRVQENPILFLEKINPVYWDFWIWKLKGKNLWSVPSMNKIQTINQRKCDIFYNFLISQIMYNNVLICAIYEFDFVSWFTGDIFCKFSHFF